jgi:hypothetical protein
VHTAARSDVEDNQHGSEEESSQSGTSIHGDSKLWTPYTAGTGTQKLPGVSKNKAPSFNQDSNTLKYVVSFYMGYLTVGGTNLYYQQYMDSS